MRVDEAGVVTTAGLAPPGSRQRASPASSGSTRQRTPRPRRHAASSAGGPNGWRLFLRRFCRGKSPSALQEPSHASSAPSLPRRARLHGRDPARRLREPGAEVGARIHRRRQARVRRGHGRVQRAQLDRRAVADARGEAQVQLLEVRAASPSSASPTPTSSRRSSPRRSASTASSSTPTAPTTDDVAYARSRIAEADYAADPRLAPPPRRRRSATRRRSSTPTRSSRTSSTTIPTRKRRSGCASSSER